MLEIPNTGPFVLGAIVMVVGVILPLVYMTTKIRKAAGKKDQDSSL